MTPVLIFILLFYPPPIVRSPECVCIRNPDRSEEIVKAERRQAFDQSTAVFAGKVVALDTYKVTFELEKRWKGDSPRGEVVLSTGAVTGYDGTAWPGECSYHFDLGQTYLVFAYGAGEKMEANRCSTLPINKAAEEEKGLDQIKPHENIPRANKSTLRQ